MGKITLVIFSADGEGNGLGVPSPSCLSPFNNSSLLLLGLQVSLYMRPVHNLAGVDFVLGDTLL
jgi:hypothetical protein